MEDIKGDTRSLDKRGSMRLNFRLHGPRACYCPKYGELAGNTSVHTTPKPFISLYILIPSL